ncbi:phosphatidylinositol/phosphatidylcholine transfer protein SFH11-like [Dioscorea cayenensis subsp. rotundata]|uniref:Phosphatidylinositol/phosphatidylcholine transfer protein SFH11-like n=1 Tax=Dioscorea cayennensis subsp. rotundata TaxID=55577 RepID=A0AB40BCM8_DIOCR|nr:phosphatidylinositol/phosphatidylcholine transfer protein SFH11-like [Dioscorea cayenensis subsp. rotundata]
MSMASQQEAIKQLIALMEQVDDHLKATFKNMHQGHPSETVSRFLKAREWNVPKTHKMLLDCLNWRINNDIDSVLSKPIIPVDLYRAVRDSQLVGLSGYTKEGLPVFAIGVGMSTFDKASVNFYLQSHIQINEYRDRVILPAASKKHGRHISNCYKILDMTGLKLCALSQLKLLTIISTVDDLNYPEKTVTYYIVNAPYVFSACWKAVKPLLHERTRKKVQVLQGSGGDELLKIMDQASLPHFCRRENSRSSHNSSRVSDCFSLDHPFHQQLYSYVKQQQSQIHHYKVPTKQGSYHFSMPNADSDGAIIVETIKSALKEQR